MDSLTQIVLGAAVGEVVLGKKIGNRAMMWGAFGGTIPDLDVLANFTMSEIDALAFHRGISHSIFFAVLSPFGLAWVVDKIYDTDLYQNKIFKAFTSVFALLFLGLILFGIGYLSKSWLFGMLGLAIFGGAAFSMWKNYFNTQLSAIKVGYKGWYWLFFWSIFTHPLLDCFTSYGTQLFLPFSDYRVAFNTISVADPIYTVPFLICLMLASRFVQTSSIRSKINWLGIGLSSAYLTFTVFNKWQVDRVFEQSLIENNIPYTRFSTNPLLLNNLLWQGVAEGDSVYYYAKYSVLDKEKRIPEFKVIPKNHELIKGIEEDETIKVLKWFSNNYYNISEGENGLEYNDLRYGSISEFIGQTEDQYVFKFRLLEEKDGVEIETLRDDPRELSSEMFQSYWDRIMGI